MKLRLATAMLFVVVLAAPTSARGQSSDAEARATKLFEEGRKLANEGRCADAIDVFLASLKEATGVGLLLNLANCYEQVGKTATAHRWFLRAEEVAREKGDPRRVEAADRARALEPRLSDLTVRVVDGAEDGLEVRLDGEPLDRAKWNVATTVDPGMHVVDAKSPKRGTTSLRIAVGSGAQHAAVVVPALQPEPPPRPPADERHAEEGGTLRTLGWGTGGVGGAALVTGTIFGVLSMIDHGHVVDRCPTYPTCPSNLRSEIDGTNDAAHTKGTVATISILAGAVLVAGGVVLILSAPHAASTSRR